MTDKTWEQEFDEVWIKEYEKAFRNAYNGILSEELIKQAVSWQITFINENIISKLARQKMRVPAVEELVEIIQNNASSIFHADRVGEVWTETPSVKTAQAIVDYLKKEGYGIKLPERKKSYEYIEVHGMKILDRRYCAGYNDCITDVETLNKTDQEG